MAAQPNHVLQRIRQQAGLTQTLFGERMGWSQAFVSQLESGERPIASHALAIADRFKTQMLHLGFSVEDLLRGRVRRGGARKAAAL